MRNLCCKCPHYYNEQSYFGEYDCGCRVFGEEFERCPSFWDNDCEADESEMGCNVHPKRIEFLLMRENKRIAAYIERVSKDNKLVKHYSVCPKEERGYKAYRKDGTWMGFWTDDYLPNLKGGHTHNHVKNAHKRMKHCAICDKPITKYEGFSSKFIGHICMECYIEECREHAVMAGIPTIGSLFDDLRNPYIRRK